MSDFSALREVADAAIRFLLTIAFCAHTGCMSDNKDIGCKQTEAGSIDQVPAISRHTQAQGLDASDQSGRIQWQMHLRSTDELDQLLKDLYTPGNPRFGQYLTPEQFRDRFHPTKAAKDRLRKHLAEHDLAPELPTSDGTAGLMVYAQGSVAQLGRAVGQTYAKFPGPSGHDVVGPTGLISQKTVEGVRAVGGPLLGVGKQAPRSQRDTTTSAWTPAQLRRAYQVPDTASAKDVSIGVIALEGYDPADITAFCKAHGIREVPRRHVFLGGFDGKVQDKDAAVETVLDISVINAIAPDAKEIVVYGAKNRGNALTALLTRIANPLPGEPMVRLVSCSWGAPESQLGHSDVLAEHDILRQCAAQGITVASASGDLGAFDDGETVGTDSPAAQPYCLAVGGSTLTLNADNSYKSEKAWTGGGGGRSCYWPAPSWQQGPFRKYMRAEATWREVPDWCAVADPSPGYAIIANGQSMSVGGTSAATPLTVAILAFAEQARMDKKLGPLGFAAPALYRVADKTNFTAFNDILIGSNSGDKGKGGYHACQYYDQCTGCGSPKAGAIIDALSQP